MISLSPFPLCPVLSSLGLPVFEMCFFSEPPHPSCVFEIFRHPLPSIPLPPPPNCPPPRGPSRPLRLQYPHCPLLARCFIIIIIIITLSLSSLSDTTSSCYPFRQPPSAPPFLTHQTRSVFKPACLTLLQVLLSLGILHAMPDILPPPYAVVPLWFLGGDRALSTLRPSRGTLSLWNLSALATRRATPYTRIDGQGPSRGGGEGGDFW
ncbi:hypothetical protein C8Q79DRAFT_497212 [Trametes meyenii]|nr:hypothetical protein C8Q79DRAFT_497212 [Trametes meyenii]